MDRKLCRNSVDWESIGRDSAPSTSCRWGRHGTIELVDMVRTIFYEEAMHAGIRYPCMRQDDVRSTRKAKNMREMGVYARSQEQDSARAGGLNMA